MLYLHHDSHRNTVGSPVARILATRRTVYLVSSLWPLALAIPASEVSLLFRFVGLLRFAGLLGLHVHRGEKFISTRIGARVETFILAQLIRAVEPDLARNPVALISLQHVRPRQHIGIELDLVTAPAFIRE